MEEKILHLLKNSESWMCTGTISTLLQKNYNNVSRVLRRMFSEKTVCRKEMNTEHAKTYYYTAITISCELCNGREFMDYDLLRCKNCGTVVND